MTVIKLSLSCHLLQFHAENLTSTVKFPITVKTLVVENQNLLVLLMR